MIKDFIASRKMKAKRTHLAYTEIPETKNMKRKTNEEKREVCLY